MRSDESSRSPAARLWCCPKRTRVNSCGICKRGICQGGGADARVRAGPPGPAAGRYQKASRMGGESSAGAKIKTFSVEKVLHVVGFPNAIPNMLWGKRLILALMGGESSASFQPVVSKPDLLELMFVQLLLDGCQQARAILARQFLFHAAKSHTHNVSMVQPGTKLVLRKL